MKKLFYISLLFISLQAVAWDSPITIPNVGNARLVIVGQNMENYMTNFDADNASCTNQSAFDSKTAKMANVFLALHADIVAVCEAERNDEILGYISAKMNELSGTNVWTYIQDGIYYATAGAGEYQAIKSGYLYRSDKVTPVGSSYSPYNSAEYKARMRIQLFKENATNELFTLSVNHFKAKSGGGDQGESTRLQNASYLISELNNITADPDILIMGDLNAYMGEAPIVNLQNAGYEEQLVRFDANAYTYIYQGERGILDHVMANSTMASQITGAYAYNINHAGYSSYKYSDHDAVLVGLNLGEQTVIDDTIPEIECPAFEYDFRNGLNDWTVYDVSGNASWSTHSTYGAQISAYQKEDNQEHWFISPVMDMSTATSATLTINHQIYYDNGTTEDYWNDQTVWVSTNYTDGMAPGMADWTQLTLSDYGYKIYIDATATIPAEYLTADTRIAFKYTAPLAANSNYWEIKTASIETECESDPTQVIETTAGQTPAGRKVLYKGALYIEFNGQWFDSMGRLISNL